jgi:hypothetical protein
MSDDLDPRKLFFKELGEEIEEFLLFLVGDKDKLFDYVQDPFDFLKNWEPEDDRPRLSNEAKAILLQSNYSVVKEAMKYRGSHQVHWVCVWVI